MLPREDILLQERLVNCVATIAPVSEQWLDTVLTRESRARLHAYQDSFRGRVVAGLSQAMLERGVELFGLEIVSELVARFFDRHPVASTQIDRSLDGLPEFIWEWGEGDERETIVGVIEVCLALWHLMLGPDPDHTRILCAYVAPRGKSNLYNAWHGADAHNGTPCGVLLHKRTFEFVQICKVHQSLDPVAKHLVEHGKVQDAFAALNDEEVAGIDESALIELLQQLS